MCGIVGGFSSNIARGIEALAHRGPDARGMIQAGAIALGHTRLSILDLDSRSDQPFTYGAVTLVYNGELWNYKELREQLVNAGLIFHTSGDTEVIAAALATWGLEALNRFNGMFALAWTLDGATLYLARDKFGEIPLHYAYQSPFYFASELKALVTLGAHPRSFTMLPPGAFAVVTAKAIEVSYYYQPPIEPLAIELEPAAAQLARLLENAVTERLIADVPVCTLLSGGIDSAAITYLAHKSLPNLVAYTAVYDPKSKDLRCAREQAGALGIELREIPVKLPELGDIRQVIRHIEMSYKAQVEIGWPCLQLAQAIQADGFKVVFSGEGSDELWASYGFAYHALLKEDWHTYRRDLFQSQAVKNFPRTNKIFMGHSIEARLPFLNPALVEFALSLPRRAVQNGTAKPKAILQAAFRGLLPDSITSRPKVAFQDGLGIKSAIASQFANPKRLYDAEYNGLYA